MIATYEPHACVVVYSVVDGNSFDMAAEIISYLWRFGFTKKATVLLVANKIDLERSRLVTCEGILFHSFLGPYYLNLLQCHFLLIFWTLVCLVCRIYYGVTFHSFFWTLVCRIY